MFAKFALLALLATATSADKRPSQHRPSYSAPRLSYRPEERLYRSDVHAPTESPYHQPEPSYYHTEPTYAPQPSYSNHGSSYHHEEKKKLQPFNFNVDVNDYYTGNKFNHGQSNDGKVTTGEYRVLLPDGRTQVVKYTADHYNGYQAEVTYEGEAKPYEAPKHTYKEPKHTYEAPSHHGNRYEAPKQTYKEPKHSYKAPSHHDNRYEAPKHTYEEPRYASDYEAPSHHGNRYEAPKHTYEEPRQSYHA